MLIFFYSSALFCFILSAWSLSSKLYENVLLDFTSGTSMNFTGILAECKHL